MLLATPSHLVARLIGCLRLVTVSRSKLTASRLRMSTQHIKTVSCPLCLLSTCSAVHVHVRTLPADFMAVLNRNTTTEGALWLPHSSCCSSHLPKVLSCLIDRSNLAISANILSTDSSLITLSCCNTKKSFNRRTTNLKPNTTCCCC